MKICSIVNLVPIGLITKWVSDITYIATKQGWCYLTAILDLADRMVVSWHLSNTLNAEQTIITTMNKALQKIV